jgi:uncharacterized protein (DUF305 family)
MNTMKTMLLASLAVVAATACSQSGNEGGNATAEQAAIADNTRPDGSIIDESKPHTHTAENAHPEPMDMAMMTPSAGDSPATRGYKSSMMKMMQGMPPFTGDADIDFNKQMRVHHLAAIDMAEAQLANGKDPATKALAQKIINDQKKEVAQIDAWLQQRGQ